MMMTWVIHADAVFYTPQGQIVILTRIGCVFVVEAGHHVNLLAPRQLLY